MFTLSDTFNNRLISSHRTLEAAVKARAKHGKAVRKANGASSYIPTQITECERVIDGSELYAAEIRAGI